MSKQLLDDPNISTVRDHVRGATMSEGVRVKSGCRQTAESGPPQQHLIDTMSRKMAPSMVKKKTGLRIARNK